jgi:hypothetical protein
LNNKVIQIALVDALIAIGISNLDVTITIAMIVMHTIIYLHTNVTVVLTIVIIVIIQAHAMNAIIHITY